MPNWFAPRVNVRARLRTHEPLAAARLDVILGGAEVPIAEPPLPLTPAQMQRIQPHFQLSRGVPRVDDRSVISGIRTADPSDMALSAVIGVYRSHVANHGCAQQAPLHPVDERGLPWIVYSERAAGCRSDRKGTFRR